MSAQGSLSLVIGLVRAAPAAALPRPSVRRRQPPIRESTMPPLSRRHLVGATLGGTTAAMISGVGTELAASRAASAQSTLSPDDALQALMDGNRRFVERRLTSFQEDIDMLMQDTAEKQEPFASVLACADRGAGRARLRPEHRPCLRQPRRRQHRDLGDHRQHRIWRRRSRHQGAHGAGPRQLRRGQGHDRRQGGAGTDQLAYSYLRPAVNQANGDLDAAIAANARIQAQFLREILDRGRGPGEGRQDQSRGRRLRSRQRQGEPAGLTVFGRGGPTNAVGKPHDVHSDRFPR